MNSTLIYSKLFHINLSVSHYFHCCNGHTLVRGAVLNRSRLKQPCRAHRNGYRISSQILLGMRLLIHAGININSCKYKGSLVKLSFGIISSLSIGQCPDCLSGVSMERLCRIWVNESLESIKGAWHNYSKTKQIRFLGFVMGHSVLYNQIAQMLAFLLIICQYDTFTSNRHKSVVLGYLGKGLLFSTDRLLSIIWDTTRNKVG